MFLQTDIESVAHYCWKVRLSAPATVPACPTSSSPVWLWNSPRCQSPKALLPDGGYPQVVRLWLKRAKLAQYTHWWAPIPAEPGGNAGCLSTSKSGEVWECVVCVRMWVCLSVCECVCACGEGSDTQKSLNKWHESKFRFWVDSPAVSQHSAFFHQCCLKIYNTPFKEETSDLLIFSGIIKWR